MAASFIANNVGRGVAGSFKKDDIWAQTFRTGLNLGVQDPAGYDPSLPGIGGGIQKIARSTAGLLPGGGNFSSIGLVTERLAGNIAPNNPWLKNSLRYGPVFGPLKTLILG